MDLKNQILADIKEAMKNRDQERLSTLRFLQSAIKNKEIDLRPEPISEEGVLAVLKKSVKQRRDSISQYEDAGRSDLVEKEKAELAILEAYLPEPLPVEKVEAIVKESIAEAGASSLKDMGTVMKLVMSKTQGQADNKIVSEIVRNQLQ